MSTPSDASSATPVLELDDITVGYGGVPAVRGLSASVRAGEILALLGPNGAGKTTTLLATVGALPLMSGSVTALGEPIDHHIERNARRGVTLVPDTRGLFHKLSVSDNLRLAKRKNGTDLDTVFGYFPKLKTMRSRHCGNLSGGEQQMLALAKALLARPRVLLIDEMSLGLSPVAVQDLLPRLRSFADEHQMAVVLVEQHIDLALGIADSAIVLHHGRVALSASAAELRSGRDKVEAAYFGRTIEEQAS
ncbi:UNVERIFIED_ORG: branched-chain amino acid transport system ATP-binding protein [Gordonia westfalica J30]